MEWEEALLRVWSGAMPPQTATFYRRRAAQARQVAHWVTTQGVKARLLEEAVHCDRLADDADRALEEAADL